MCLPDVKVKEVAMTLGDYVEYSPYIVVVLHYNKHAVNNYCALSLECAISISPFLVNEFSICLIDFLSIVVAELRRNT